MYDDQVWRIGFRGRPGISRRRRRFLDYEDGCAQLASKRTEEFSNKHEEEVIERWDAL
jgi:hypothetical protein